MRRQAYVVAGHCCVALGVVGAFVPVMPSVDFLVVAAACYAKGNPELRRRLLAHPRLGPPIRDWEEHRALTRADKLRGIVLVTLGIGATVVFGVRAAWLRAVLVLIWGGVVLFLLLLRTRPERPMEGDSVAS